MIAEIRYQFETLLRWIREKKLILLGIKRKFDCQSQIEGNRKCKYECEHCKSYYSQL
jgi:hypothetical protein